METFFIQCPNCGSLISLNQGKKLGKCYSCDEEWFYLDNKNFEQLAFFDKLDKLRISGEFDKAILLAKKHLSLYQTFPEIYFLIVLCEYRVRFVNDFFGNLCFECDLINAKSIFSNENYLFSINLGDDNQKEFFKKIANKIGKIKNEEIDILLNMQRKTDTLEINEIDSIDAENSDLKTKSGKKTNKKDKVLSKSDAEKHMKSLIREKSRLKKIRDTCEENYNDDRQKIQWITDKRKTLETEKAKIDKILETKDFYKNLLKKKINSFIWLRLLATVLLVTFAFSISEWFGVAKNLRIPSSLTLIFVGLVFIWIGQWTSINKKALDKKRQIDIDKESQIREQIISCETQLSSLSRKYEKSKEELLFANESLAIHEEKISEFANKYNFLDIILK